MVDKITVGRILREKKAEGRGFESRFTLQRIQKGRPRAPSRILIPAARCRFYFLTVSAEGCK